MSQKSILSFFKKTPVKAASTSPEVKPKPETKTTPETSPIVNSSPPQRAAAVVDNDDSQSSPVKPLNSSLSSGIKKRRRIISSSGEEDEDGVPENAKESPKKSETAANGKKHRPSSSPEDVKTTATSITKTSPVAKKSPQSATKAGKKTIASTKKVAAKKPKVKSESESENDEADDVKPGKKSSPKAATVKKSTKSTKSSPPSGSDENKPTENIKTEVTKTPTKSPAADKPKPTGMASFFTSTARKTTTDNTAAANQYNPAKANYHPIDDAFWRSGDATPYLALTKTFSIIEATSGRLKMIEYLANFLRSVIVLSPADLPACIYLCLNQLAPAYEGIELGIAETTLMKVIVQTTGRSMAQVKQDARDTGDLGLVAEQSKSNQRMMIVPAALTVPSVFAKLKDIARKTGASAMNTKADKIQAIFVACRQSEARYFIRSLLGKLRTGLAEQSVLQALAQACALTPPEMQKRSDGEMVSAKRLHGDALKAHIDATALTLKTAYCQCPNYDRLIGVLMEHGIDELLARCPMEPGTPLKPMLAHPTRGIQEVLQRFDGIRFTAEWKYDGERAQIHIDDEGRVSIYSRNQENNTSKYPDIIERVARAFTAEAGGRKSCILDCEAVAWDAEREQILPFQVLSTRKRKDAVVEDISVRVCVFMFDLLYWDGEPLVERPFAERRAKLQRHFAEVPGEWRFATSLDTADMDELQAFLDVSIRGNCEGLMVKTLDEEATYEIAKRSRNWLKIKKDYVTGVGDSLDLVVIGGYHGKGRRTGTYGGFLLACYDADTEQYQSICKIGTGFSDEDLAQHTEFLGKVVIAKAKSYYAYDAAHEADVWFEPVQVWEVLCADLSLSPVHQAAKGIVDPEKGISLRFPRFIRIRDDKNAEDATSAQQVADMYSNQDQIKNQERKKDDVDEEFY